jgi:hypothetical protein
MAGFFRFLRLKSLPIFGPCRLWWLFNDRFLLGKFSCVASAGFCALSAGSMVGPCAVRKIRFISTINFVIRCFDLVGIFASKTVL